MFYAKLDKDNLNFIIFLVIKKTKQKQNKNKNKKQKTKKQKTKKPKTFHIS